MSYYGQIPFNTNGGSMLSKRNYINRKLNEIEQKLLQLGWIEPDVEDEQITETEEITNEYNMPVESAGALLPYRDKVNKKLDFFEEVISSHINRLNNYNNRENNIPTYYNNYEDNNRIDYKPKDDYVNSIHDYVKPDVQDEVKKSFDEVVFRKMS